MRSMIVAASITLILSYLLLYIFNLPHFASYIIFGNTSEPASHNMTAKLIANNNPLPSYFISHGGPTFMYTKLGTKNSEGAASTIRRLGDKIRRDLKPDYIIVLSAHWQASASNLIEISISNNKTNENKLIYDFYGFPGYMYKEQFHTKNSVEIATSIQSLLQENGIPSKLNNRGIDHGVWVPFKVAFSNYNQLSGTPLPEGELDVDIPIIQVSLPSKELDFEAHYNLGKVLNQLRVNNIYQESTKKYLSGLVITSGMSVHNLRDLGIAMSQAGAMSYVKPFNQLLTKSLTEYQDDRLQGFNMILTKYRNLLFDAHPTLEHFVPIIVSSGMVAEEKGVAKELYNASEMSLGWGIYQFGEEPKNLP